MRGQVLRSYTLLAAETLIIVNHMVRLAGLRFSPGPGGPADRQLRSAREKLYYIGLQTHYSLEACCSEDQSYLFGGVDLCKNVC